MKKRDLNDEIATEAIVVNSYRAYDAAIALAEREHHSARSLKGVERAARFLSKILISVHEIRLASIKAGGA